MRNRTPSSTTQGRAGRPLAASSRQSVYALAALVAGVVLWLTNDGSPLWLLPALLLPDVSAAGYLVNPRVGAVTYNAIDNDRLQAGGA